MAGSGGGWPGALTGVRGGILKISIILTVVYLLAFLLPRSFEAADYRHFPLIGSRVLVWCLAQAHLLFAAFVLGVPIFALIAEMMGHFLKDERYDGLAKEFTRLLAMSYAITATLGGLLLLALVTLYPRFVAHMEKVFEPSWSFYILAIFGEAVARFRRHRRYPSTPLYHCVLASSECIESRRHGQQVGRCKYQIGF